MVNGFTTFLKEVSGTWVQVHPCTRQVHPWNPVSPSSPRASVCIPAGEPTAPPRLPPPPGPPCKRKQARPQLVPPLMTIFFICLFFRLSHHHVKTRRRRLSGQPSASEKFTPDQCLKSGYKHPLSSWLPPASLKQKCKNFDIFWPSPLFCLSDHLSQSPPTPHLKSTWPVYFLPD